MRFGPNAQIPAIRMKLQIISEAHSLAQFPREDNTAVRIREPAFRGINDGEARLGIEIGGDVGTRAGRGSGIARELHLGGRR